MPGSPSSILTFYLAAFAGLTILVVAVVAAVWIAQRRLVAQHQEHTRQLLAAQDEERAWVAREVHDDAVQRLAALRHELSALQVNAPTAERSALDGTIAEVQDLAVSLRQLAHRLHPSSLDRDDLGVALEQLREEVLRLFGLSVSLDVAVGDLRPRQDLVPGIYRICQEALRNVARHAGVQHAAVRVAFDGSRLVLDVRDEGAGFTVTGDRSGGEGIGLFSIRERVRLLGGQATITSAPGKGTSITATFPHAVG